MSHQLLMLRFSIFITVLLINVYLLSSSFALSSFGGRGPSFVKTSEDAVFISSYAPLSCDGQVFSYLKHNF
jgi:hypothetical protein